MSYERATQLFGKLLLVLFFLTVTALPFSAQQQPGPPVDRTNPERARQQEMSTREWQLRNIGKVPPQTRNERLQALMLQTEEDFNRILTLHNQLARAATSDKPLDFNFVSSAAGEIKKRATRLQSTLVLGDSDHNETEAIPEFRETQMKEAVVLLCKQIKSFVTNPVIETPGTVNAEQLKMARKDLDSLIKLSSHLKKDSEKIRKLHQE